MYGDIQWINNRALAGINAGDGMNHITIPGSLTPSMIDIEETSNVDIPGVWIFKIEEGNTSMHIIKYGSVVSTVYNRLVSNSKNGH